MADAKQNVSVLMSPFVYHGTDHQELKAYRMALSLTNQDTDGIKDRLMREANGDLDLLDFTAENLILGLCDVRLEIGEANFYFRTCKNSKQYMTRWPNFVDYLEPCFDSVDTAINSIVTWKDNIRA